jgi:hypothetical protein
MSPGWARLKVARPEGFEPPTLCLEGRRSIHLSYGRDAGNEATVLRQQRFSQWLQYRAVRPPRVRVSLGHSFTARSGALA